MSRYVLLSAISCPHEVCPAPSIAPLHPHARGSPPHNCRPITSEKRNKRQVWSSKVLGNYSIDVLATFYRRPRRLG